MLTLCLMGCQRLSSIGPSTPSAKPPATPPVSSGVSTTEIPKNLVVDVADRVGGAVVRIDSSRTVTTHNSPLRQFFGDAPTEERVEEGSGSGFILRPQGFILTNAHVVEGADQVTVKLKDGRSFPGKVLGQDSLTDVAVVKIEAQNLPTVTLGDSDALKPGEWAIAIGNPLGLDNTVTLGIISAMGRSSSDIGVPDKQVGFIQTDAAINPGNSGGPLLSPQGQVIGMNTAIIGGAQGLGFAIPINTVKNLAEQLIRDGKVQHPYLGIHMVTLTPEIAAAVKTKTGLSLDNQTGVLITRVVPRSPAATAGLLAGDVIQKIGDQSITAAQEVQQQVAKSQVGQSLRITVWRKGKTETVEVKLGDFPASRKS
jgi:Do/DeqQ family serine protease